MAKQKNSPAKAYTIQELEEKVKSAEDKILFLQKRISKIKPWLSKSQGEYNELIIQKDMLEQELKKYTGFLARVKFSIKSALSGNENEANVNQKQLSSDLDAIQTLIDEKAKEVKDFEDAIADNEQKIEELKSDSKRWQTKLKKRRGSDDDSPNNSTEQTLE